MADLGTRAGWAMELIPMCNYLSEIKKLYLLVEYSPKEGGESNARGTKPGVGATLKMELAQSRHQPPARPDPPEFPALRYRGPGT